MPFRQALAAAQKLAVAGVELDAAGEFSPHNLSATGRRELRHLLRSHNLELTALACPLRRGLDVALNQEQRIDHVRQVMTMSFDLGPRLVTVSAGQVPDTDEDVRASLLKESLAALGRHGDRVGATLALATGAESGLRLNDFLARLGSGSLAACFSPRNMLINSNNPYPPAPALSQRIVHVCASDARHTGAGVRAVPLGHGDIDWLQMLGVLAEIDYHGWLVIEGDGGPQGLAESAAAVLLLRQLAVS